MSLIYVNPYSFAAAGTTGTAGQNYILGVKFVELPDAGFGISIGTNGVSTYEHSNSYMPPLLVHETTITSFANIVIVYNNKQPSLYINGTFIKTGLTSPRPNVYLIGDFIAFGDYSYYQGKLASIRYYERAITATEVTQNFNALRSRYGL
jgi:O-antigen biosynthesis protein